MRSARQLLCKFDRFPFVEYRDGKIGGIARESFGEKYGCLGALKQTDAAVVRSDIASKWSGAGLRFDDLILFAFLQVRRIHRRDAPTSFSPRLIGFAPA